MNDSYLRNRWLFAPLASCDKKFVRLLAGMHHGWLNAYVAYAIVTVLVAMVLTHQW